LLGELIAGALILYPRYVSPVSRVAISPEHALDLLVASRDARERESATRRSLRTAWRSVVRLGLRTVTAHR
jgi:capsule polysaccharide export protein KpsC/LpsZ